MLTLRLQRLLVRKDAKHITYKNLIPQHMASRKGDSLYTRKVGANMREIVQRYESGARKERVALDETAIRAAFTMREKKQNGEQEALLQNTLNAYALKASRDSVYNPIRKEKLEGVVEGMKIQQERLMREYQRSLSNKIPASLPAISTASGINAEMAHEIALVEEERRKLEEERREQQELVRIETEKKRRTEAEERVRERERQRESARRKAMLEVAQEEARRKSRMPESPQEILHRFYEPIFRALWDMEFDGLNGTNPFRVVIDEHNCAAHGVPDYCSIVQKPMNLTYIREKVNRKEYPRLQDFFDDVNLLIKNALLYNSDPADQFHLAAKELRKKYRNLAKEVVQKLKGKKQK